MCIVYILVYCARACIKDKTFCGRKRNPSHHPLNTSRSKETAKHSTQEYIGCYRQSANRQTYFINIILYHYDDDSTYVNVYIKTNHANIFGEESQIKQLVWLGDADESESYRYRIKK